MNVNHDSYLRPSVGYRVVDCLLDTASEICLFVEHIVDSALEKKTKKDLKSGQWFSNTHS